MMMYGWGGLGWIGMIINLVVTIGVIVGLVLLVVWAVRRMSGTTFSGSQSRSASSAKEIAQERYAKGEINRDEYQQILSDLGK